MERLKQMKEQLVSCVQGQMTNLAHTDTKELGEAIDMIKDLEEAMYYCSITKAMEEREKEEKEGRGKERHYYIERYLPPYMTGEDYNDRDMDRKMGRMYYPRGRNAQGEFTGNGGNRGKGGRSYYGSDDGPYVDGYRIYGDEENYSETSMHGFHDREYPMEMRDHREGQSPIHRKYYIEAKELKHDKKAQMEELEKYMHELSKDITEMITGATPEETTLLKQKLVTLIEKIK